MKSSKIRYRAFSLFATVLIQAVAAVSSGCSNSAPDLGSLVSEKTQNRLHWELAVLTTPRTIIRHIVRSEDVADLRAVLGAPENIGMSGSPFDEQSLEEILAVRPYAWARSDWDLVPFAIVSIEENRLIGMLEIYRAYQLPTLAQIAGDRRLIRKDWAGIGYQLAKPYWGKGIMTEVLRAVVSYGFDNLDLSCWYAETLETNKGSQRVLEKNGFDKLGDQTVYYNYHWSDHSFFLRKKNSMSRCNPFENRFIPGR